jgi:hypothetical protein
MVIAIRIIPNSTFFILADRIKNDVGYCL